MRTLIGRQAVAGLTLAGLAVSFLALKPEAARKEISGTFSAAYTNQQTANVADAPGHMLMLTESKGSNQSNGSTDFLEGAQVTNSEIADLTQGNGPHQGYTRFVEGSSSTVAKWQGTVTTTMGSDNQPRTSFKGTWSYVAGTGDNAGIKGNGTYDGQLTSQKEYTVDWKGSYSK
jgi:hypothetical protein